jgi:hypothetical protein
MRGCNQTGHFPYEDQKLDSLRPGSREMEDGGGSEGQNFHLLKKVQRLEEEEEYVFMHVCKQSSRWEGVLELC